MSEQTVDWRALPAGRKLDRVVAERMGWTEIVEYRDDTLFVYAPGQRYDSEELPRFSTDANAALALAIDMPERQSTFVLEFDRYTWTAYLKYYADRFGAWVDGEKMTANEAPLAIVRAFLTWKDGQRE